MLFPTRGAQGRSRLEQHHSQRIARTSRLNIKSGMAAEQHRDRRKRARHHFRIAAGSGQSGAILRTLVRAFGQCQLKPIYQAGTLTMDVQSRSNGGYVYDKFQWPAADCPNGTLVRRGRILLFRYFSRIWSAQPVQENILAQAGLTLNGRIKRMR